jgi:hypothetical protein
MQPGSFAPPPPVLPSDDYGPSKWWFLVAGLVAVGGIALAILIFVVGLMNFFDRIEGFQRVDVPGTAQVVLGTGGYSVYHEYTGASSDIGIGFVGMPAVTITSPSGDAVDLRPYTTNVTYSGSGYEGEGILTFDADEAGTYVVEASGEPGSEVAIGRGIGAGMVGTVVGAFVAGGVGILAGLIVAIVVGVRRSQNRRSRMGPFGPPGPPGGGWGPQYPSYAPPGQYGPPGRYGPGYGVPGGYGPPPGGYPPDGPPPGAGYPPAGPPPGPR